MIKKYFVLIISLVVIYCSEGGRVSAIDDITYVKPDGWQKKIVENENVRAFELITENYTVNPVIMIGIQKFEMGDTENNIKNIAKKLSKTLKNFHLEKIIQKNDGTGFLNYSANVGDFKIMWTIHFFTKEDKIIMLSYSSKLNKHDEYYSIYEQFINGVKVNNGIE